MAYADGHGGPSHDSLAGFTHHPTHTTLHNTPTAATHASTHPHNDGEGSDANDPTATNGGRPLAGDTGLTLAQLKPTPEPLTAYEMPFPCGQTWTGSTHAGHTPSIRAVDWNSANDFGSPVVAAADGTVVTAVVGKNKPSYGQYVVIDHGNGESSLYGHLDSVLVTVGQAVTMGTQIGTLGDTGNSTGPHLHFEERNNGSVVDAWFHGAKFPMNTSATSQNCGGHVITPPSNVVPLAGNLYGGLQAEVVLFQRSSPAKFEVTRTGTAAKVITMGAATDQPVLGDWDGDGRVSPGVRNPATRTFRLKVPGKDQTIRFGKPTDLPIAGNWDGQGPWEVGVRRASSGTFKLRAATGKVTTVKLGTGTDLPVTGDWDGNGTTDLGVYNPTTAVFTLEWVDDEGIPWSTDVAFGTPGNLPVTGDWDGNGITDVGVYDPVTGQFSERTAPSISLVRSTTRRVGFAHARLPKHH